MLEGLEAVRKRPAMYIGSTDTRGLMHCLWEIIDNAVDEALGGFGTEILITLRSDGGISVHDQGRGIPVDIEPRTGLSGVEVVFTKLHAGGKFGAGSYNATGGLHGVGSSVVNALSSRLDVEVDRNGGHLGDVVPPRCTPGSSTGRGRPRSSPPAGPCAKIGRAAEGRTGTRVTYWPDRQIFLNDAELSLKDLQDRARQTSFLVPGLALTVVDARTKEVTEETFRHAGGISEFCEFLAPDPRAHRGGPAAWAEPVHRDRADAGRRRSHGADRRRAGSRRRHRRALGDWLRHQGPVLRQHHRHPEGWHPRPGLRARADPGLRQCPAEHPAAQGGGGHRQG